MVASSSSAEAFPLATALWLDAAAPWPGAMCSWWDMCCNYRGGEGNWHKKVSMSQLTCIHSHVLPRCSVSFVSPPLCSPPALLTACLTPGPRLQPLPWALLTCLSPWASLHLSPSHCLACVAVSSSLFPLLSPSLAFLCDGPVGGCQGARQQCREAGAGVP